MGQLMKHVVIVLNCMVLTLALQAQTVRNVKATQEGQKIAISYELVCAQPTEINLFLSEDNGQTWNAVKTGVSGDVGLKVTQGNKVIYWDVLQSKEKLVGNAFVFKVKVKDQNKNENEIKDIKSVKIGDQVWMVENLDVDHFRNGDPITEVRDAVQWSELNFGAWCYYDNDLANGEIYGKLYNCFAVNDKRGLCPAGWHLPSDTEWSILEDYLGGSNVAGGKMKSKKLWKSPNLGASNSARFNALPGGYRNVNGFFRSNGDIGHWWLNSEPYSSESWSRKLTYNFSNVGRTRNVMQDGFSVRCIKD